MSSVIEKGDVVTSKDSVMPIFQAYIGRLNRVICRGDKEVLDVQSRTLYVKIIVNGNVWYQYDTGIPYYKLNKISKDKKTKLIMGVMDMALSEVSQGFLSLSQVLTCMIGNPTLKAYRASSPNRILFLNKIRSFTFQNMSNNHTYNASFKETDFTVDDWVLIKEEK